MGWASAPPTETPRGGRFPTISALPSGPPTSGWRPEYVRNSSRSASAFGQLAECLQVEHDDAAVAGVDPTQLLPVH